MSKEPLNADLDPALIACIATLAEDISALCLKRTGQVRALDTDQKRVGVMAAALIGAAQDLDGANYRAPGITSQMAAVLALHQVRYLQAMAEKATRRPSDPRVPPGRRGPGDLARDILEAAGDSGDNKNTNPENGTLSPSVPADNAQEFVSLPIEKSVQEQKP